MRFIRLLALASGLLISLTCLTAAAFSQAEPVSDDFYPIWSPDGEKIAFVSTRMGSYDIFTMNPDGSEVTQLTDDPAWDSQIDWSPQGTQIAFASTRTGNGDIYTMDADGSNLRQLTDHPGYEADPVWSPDGSRLLFSRRVDRANYESDFTLILLDIETGTEFDFGSLFWNGTDENYSIYGIWSPDGSQILMTYFVQYGTSESDCMNDGNLYLADADDQTIREVIHLDGGGYFYSADWLEDNTVIVRKSVDEQCFTRLASGWYELDLATRTLTERFYSNVYGGMAMTSDGEQIAYSSYTGENNQIIVTDPSLFSLEVMLESEMVSNPYGVSWSPDGKALVASVCTERDADVFVIDIETGEAINLTKNVENSADGNTTECGMLG